MRDFRPGPGGGLQVELSVALPPFFAGVGVRVDRGRGVALVEFNTLGVELDVLELERFAQSFADLYALRAGVT